MIMILNQSTDLSNLIGTIKWSGDKSQMARKLAFDYAYTSLDGGVRRVEIRVGMRLQMYTDTRQLLFDGVVITEEYQETDIKKSITAADYGYYLKSEVYGSFQGTPATVARMVLQQSGIPEGMLADAPVETELLVTGDKTIYQTIMAAYETAGLDVYLYMQGMQVCIGVMGSAVAGPVTGNDFLCNATYQSSMEKMYNRVAIVNQKAALLDILDHTEDLQYGILQKVYCHDDDKKSPQEEAAKLLAGLENSGSIELRGDWSFVAGNAIRIVREQSKIEGVFHITSDSHTIANGIHTTSLTLEYKE